MDKISSILPSNKRTKSSDVDESHPARPGTTSLGRTVGTTASEREKIRVQFAEKAKAEAQSQVQTDSMSFSDQAKQSAISEQPSYKASMEKDKPSGAATPTPPAGPQLKSYLDEMSGEPSYEHMISPDNIKQSPLKENTARDISAKAAAPSFFIDNQTPAQMSASAHSLDKYA